MYKQLNGSVLKSHQMGGKELVRQGSGQNFVFRFGPGQARAKILIPLSGQAGIGQKHLFLFWVRPGPKFIFLVRARLGQKNLPNADLYHRHTYKYIYICAEN